MKQAGDDGELLKGQQANEIQKRSNRFEHGRGAEEDEFSVPLSD